jgi:uncharacterized membrane protein YdbT with pleckstrin-like domain
MKYLDTLSPSETLLLRGRLHPLFKLRIWLLFFVLLALTGWAASAFPDQFTWPYAAGSVALSAILCLRAIIPLWTLEFGLTDNGIIIKRGLISYSIQEMQLKTIEEVNVTQSWFGRLFDYGTVQVRGIGIDTLTIEWVVAPFDFRNAIEKALRGAPPGGRAPAAGVSERA